MLHCIGLVFSKEELNYDSCPINQIDKDIKTEERKAHEYNEAQRAGISGCLETGSGWNEEMKQFSIPFIFKAQNGLNGLHF